MTTHASQMERMEKSLESVTSNFASIRTGRATPTMLDRVKVHTSDMGLQICDDYLALCTLCAMWPLPISMWPQQQQTRPEQRLLCTAAILFAIMCKSIAFALHDSSTLQALHWTHLGSSALWRYDYTINVMTKCSLWRCLCVKSISVWHLIFIACLCLCCR